MATAAETKAAAQEVAGVSGKPSESAQPAATGDSTQGPDAAPTPVTAPVVHQIAIPATWFLGGHGDPVAQFDYLQLKLHEDGTVSWIRDAPDGG